jgi:hypothetical protein
LQLFIFEEHDLKVTSKRDEQNNKKKVIFVGVLKALEGHCGKKQDPDPLVRGTDPDPYKNITNPEHGTVDQIKVDFSESHGF